MTNRLPAWTELELAVNQALVTGEVEPPKGLIYHAQRAQPLIRNACKSDDERVQIATLNAMREMALAWVECEADLKSTTRAILASTHSLLQVWRPEVVAQLVARIEEVRADRQREFAKMR